MNHAATLMQLATLLVMRVTAASNVQTLYETLGVPRGATAKEIKKAWHLLALRLHPDKVEGTPQQVEDATLKFKAAAEAYEVLSDVSLRKRYDATGIVPDEKTKNDAQDKRSSGGSNDPDDQWGFEGDQGPRRGHNRFGFGYRFDAFEIGLAQQRAKRVRSLGQLRRLLQPEGGVRRVGLIGFYRRGEEAALKQGLRFPYPFAGWSLAHQGDGFWWEDAVQTVLVSVGELASNEGQALLAP